MDDGSRKMISVFDDRAGVRIHREWIVLCEDDYLEWLVGIEKKSAAYQWRRVCDVRIDHISLRHPFDLDGDVEIYARYDAPAPTVVHDGSGGIAFFRPDLRARAGFIQVCMRLPWCRMPRDVRRIIYAKAVRLYHDCLCGVFVPRVLWACERKHVCNHLFDPYAHVLQAGISTGSSGGGLFDLIAQPFPGRVPEKVVQPQPWHNVTKKEAKRAQTQSRKPIANAKKRGGKSKRKKW